MPRDRRLQRVTEIPVIKVDNLYQVKREKLHGYKLTTLPFITSVSGTRYPCCDYDFMLIYTDGAINHDNVGRVNPVGYNSVLSIEFDDNEEYIIKGETIRPIPLIKKKFFRFYNEMGVNQAEAEAIQTGYGNLYILLTNYPYEWNIKKDNPNFCGFVNDLPAILGSHDYWIGVIRPNALYDSLIPYIPNGYEGFNLCWNAVGGTVTVTVYQYLNSKCVSPLPHASASTSICSASKLAACASTPLCTDRVRINISNTHASQTADVYFQGHFYGKADNR